MKNEPDDIDTQIDPLLLTLKRLTSFLLVFYGKLPTYLGLTPRSIAFDNFRNDNDRADDDKDLLIKYFLYVDLIVATALEPDTPIEKTRDIIQGFLEGTGYPVDHPFNKYTLARFESFRQVVESIKGKLAELNMGDDVKTAVVNLASRKALNDPSSAHKAFLWEVIGMFKAVLEDFASFAEHSTHSTVSATSSAKSIRDKLSDIIQTAKDMDAPQSVFLSILYFLRPALFTDRVPYDSDDVLSEDVIKDASKSYAESGCSDEELKSDRFMLARDPSKLSGLKDTTDTVPPPSNTFPNFFDDSKSPSDSSGRTVGNPGWFKSFNDVVDEMDKFGPFGIGQPARVKKMGSEEEMLNELKKIDRTQYDVEVTGMVVSQWVYDASKPVEVQLPSKEDAARVMLAAFKSNMSAKVKPRVLVLFLVSDKQIKDGSGILNRALPKLTDNIRKTVKGETLSGILSDGTFDLDDGDKKDASLYMLVSDSDGNLLDGKIEGKKGGAWRDPKLTGDANPYYDANLKKQDITDILKDTSSISGSCKPPASSSSSSSSVQPANKSVEDEIEDLYREKQDDDDKGKKEDDNTTTSMKNEDNHTSTDDADRDDDIIAGYKTERIKAVSGVLCSLVNASAVRLTPDQTIQLASDNDAGDKGKKRYIVNVKHVTITEQTKTVVVDDANTPEMAVYKARNMLADDKSGVKTLADVTLVAPIDPDSIKDKSAIKDKNGSFVLPQTYTYYLYNNPRNSLIEFKPKDGVDDDNDEKDDDNRIKIYYDRTPTADS